MIIKLFDLKNKKLSDFKSVLLYGVNQGYKINVIKENFIILIKNSECHQKLCQFIVPYT